jgi:hypothetical protein
MSMKNSKPGLHDPVRGENETQDAYCARQRASRDAVARMTLRGIGNQNKAPSSREQLRKSTRDRLRANGVARAKAHRAIQREAARG